MDIEKFLNSCTSRFSVIDGVGSFKRNQWFRHLLLPHPPRAEYQKCQEREVLHRLTRRKVLETGTKLETESFVLGLIHRFHLFNFPSAVAAASFWNISQSAGPASAGVCTCAHRHAHVLPYPRCCSSTTQSPTQLTSTVLRGLFKEAFARTGFPKLPGSQGNEVCLMVSAVPSHISQRGAVWQIIGFHHIVVV